MRCSPREPPRGPPPRVRGAARRERARDSGSVGPSPVPGASPRPVVEYLPKKGW
jgi:hypothetical protein